MVPFSIGRQTHVVQAGTVLKQDNGPLNVSFPIPFTNMPVVVLTPNYVVNARLTGPEVVIETTLEGFTLDSQNNAVDYFVNWIAYGSM